MAAIVEFENVCFHYPESSADILNDISLCIHQGEFTAVLGHNGSGKSTLAKHMNGILIPTKGTVKVFGMDTADTSKLLSIRQTVGMVFQNPDNQIVSNVVEEDVAFAPENLGIDPAEIRERVDNALKTVGMYEYRLHAPHLLSGGQKQRVAIAGVLAMKPQIIVLDEPTAMLDPQGRREVISTVQRLCRENGITVVLITHHMEECILADRVIIMSGGRISMDGTPARIFSQSVKLEAEGLDVPETARIIEDLNRCGFELPITALTTEKCAEEIARAIHRRRV